VTSSWFFLSTHNYKHFKHGIWTELYLKFQLVPRSKHTEIRLQTQPVNIFGRKRNRSIFWYLDLEIKRSGDLRTSSDADFYNVAACVTDTIAVGICGGQCGNRTVFSSNLAPPSQYNFSIFILRLSQKPLGLRFGSAAAHFLGLWFRIPPGAWI